MASIAPPEHADSTAKASRKPGFSPDDGEMRRVLNVRLLVVTVVVMAVLVPSAYFWHAYQAKHVATAFLDHAKSLEEEGKMDHAAVYIGKYLRVYPNDHATRYHLAEIWDEGAQSGTSKATAITHYRDFLATAPDPFTIADAQEREAMAEAIEDSRCRVAEMLVDVRVKRYIQAEEAARDLLASDEKHPVGLKVLALSSYHRWDDGSPDSLPIDQIVEQMQVAQKAAPEDTTLAVTLATFYRDKSTEGTPEERGKAADEVIDAMVTANDSSADALLVRAKYRLRYKLDGAQKDLEEANQLDPGQFDILLTSALDAYRSGVEAVQRKQPDAAARSMAVALERFKKVIAAAPKRQDGYQWAGMCQLLLKKPGRAIDTWREGLTQVRADSLDSIQLHLRLVEALLDLEDRLDEADSSLAALEQNLAALAQRIDPAQKVAVQYAIDYYRGKSHVLRKEHQQGVQRLEPVLAAGTRTNLSVKQDADAKTLLARAYAGMEQWDKAARWFDESIRVFSRYQDKSRDLLRRHLSAADAYRKAGQMGGAAEHYAKILEYPKSLDDKTWLSALHMIIQHQASLPEEDRNWDVVEQNLDRPPAKLRNSWMLNLLMAEFALAQGAEQGIQRAFDLMDLASKQAPDSKELHRRLAYAYQRFGNSEQAERAREKYAKLAGNTVRRYLTVAEMLGNAKQFDKAKEVLDEGLQNLPEEKHASLKYALQMLNLRQGDVDAATRDFEKLHESDPSNPKYIRELAELALQQRDYQALERWEAALKQAEGEDSVLWRYYRGRRLLAVDQRVDPSVVAEVEQLLSTIETKQPDWAEGRLLRGRLALRRNDLQEAVNAYIQAIQLGDARLSTYIQLITMLHRGGRIDDAGQYLERVKDYIAVSPQLRYLQVDIAVAKGQKQRALDLANDAIRIEPKDAGAWVKLGQAQEQNDLINEAKDSFINAWKLASDRIQPWMALYTFYARHGRKDIAKEVLMNPPRDPEVPPAELARHLAEGYALIGEHKVARDFYEEARRRAPEDVELLMRFAAYIVPFDPAEAERLWQQVIELAPNNAHAKRNVVRLLNARGEWQEAVRMLENSKDIDDQRLLANILVRRGTENRDRARRMLEPIALSAQANADDRRTLAVIYETDGNPLSAQRQYQELTAGSSPEVEHLHAYLDYLLRHNDTGMAARVVEKLKSVDADSFATMQREARWLKADDRVDAIKPRVEAFAEKRLQEAQSDPEKVVVLVNTGNVYLAAELFQEAESWYRKLVELAPNEYGPLAAALVGQKRYAEALELCSAKAKEGDMPRAAIVLGRAYASGKPKPEDYKAAKSLLDDVVSKHPDDVELLFTAGLVNMSAGQPEQAVELYERLLKLQPGNVAALNNLAAALWELPNRRDEALPLIDQAIKLRGEQPALLDTKAMVLLETDANQAVELLEEITRIGEVDPRFHLHLAAAYHRNGSRSDAQRALQKAHDNDLAAYSLTRSEQQLLNEMKGMIATP